MQNYIVHYGEIGLKGRNLPDFERRLYHNLQAALSDLPTAEVNCCHRYYTVEVGDDVPSEAVEARLSRVFGVAYFAPAIVVPPVREAIFEAGLRLARETITAETPFKVVTNRGDKTFPIHSIDLNRELGAEIVDLTGAPVSLHTPEVVLYIQIYPEGAYLFTRHLPGPGGLPVGSSGRVIVLLSGGIDSPVAAHLMLKRGCSVEFLHFHMLRSEEEIREAKVVALARTVMAPHRLPSIVHMVPAHPFQLAMMTYTSRVELVVFRRFILRVAERLAAQRHALACVTGDDLGQVASQTLQNLAVTSRAVTLPILRPLISFDKGEVVQIAQALGTYELSIQPYQDPCSLHAHRPATWAKLEAVEELEAKLDLEALIQETLAQMVDVWIGGEKSEG